MSVLEGACVDHVVNAVEDLVPLALVLLHAHRLLVGHLACAHDRLLAVDPWRDEDGQTARDVLTLLAYGVERVHRSLCGTADLGAYVPSLEALVVAIHLPHLVDDVTVVLDLVCHVARVPVVARVVESEIELHAILIGQTQIHVDEVDRRHVAALLQQIW